MKVLIIDDEKGILKMYAEYLKTAGIEVLQATDGEVGIKMAELKKPDIIMLDIIMPRYNGLDVLKDIKKNSEIRDIPVFLLTNLPEESSGQKAKDLGATGYLVKAQYEPKMLLETIQGALGIKPKIQPNQTTDKEQGLTPKLTEDDVSKILPPHTKY